MRIVTTMMVAAALGLVPVAALAQEPAAPAAVCAAMDKTLPADLTGWTAKAPLSAATDAAGLAKAALPLGKSVEAELPQTPAVHYVTQPERPGGSVSHGGMFEIRVDKPGSYLVALGTGAWIDVLKDGKPLTSTAHSRGPECTTLRKIVDFPMEPGRYVLQVSGNAEAKLAVMLARRP